MSRSLAIVELPRVSQVPGRRSMADRRIGSLSLLEWIVRRVSDAEQVDQVVVLADGIRHVEREPLVPSDVAVFTPEEGDTLRRFASCVDRFGATEVIRVCAGNCFVDPELLDRLINAARSDGNCDYASYRRSDGRDAVHATIGLVAEWLTADAVRRAEREARGSVDRSDATRYVFAHPERFRLRLLPIPAPFDSRRNDVRLTLRVGEDWDHAQAILDDLGPDAIDWRRIALLLDRQPAMRERMASLNRAERT